MKFLDVLKKNKIPIFIYIALLSFFSLYFLSYDNGLSYGFEITIFALLLGVGIFSIIYYGKNTKNLHKVAFVIILLFGLVSVFVSPICDISDEVEHLTRVEIVSEGQIDTDYVLIPGTDVHGYKIIESVNNLILAKNMNVFNTDIDDEKISYDAAYFNSAFSQNPFYAYLVAAIGMLFAKLLDLNAIWLLWLSRMANLLFYAAIVSFAIKKSPVFKLPLFIVSLVPLAIYQAASVSADCIFNAFAILSIAYFFILYKSDKIKWKNIGIFYGAILLCGLLKAPYLALSLLIFVVPSNNFKDKTQNIVSKALILVLLAIGLIWNSYSAPQILNSWRIGDFRKYHVNATEQIAFLSSNPLIGIGNFFRNIIGLPVIVDRLFCFSNSFAQYSSTLLAALYAVYIGIFSLFYPLKEKLSKINRLKVAIVGLIIYTGIFFVQYLTWVPVGSTNVTSGVFGRYFIPLIVFLPLIFNLTTQKEINKEKFTLICIAISISFIASMLMLTVMVRY